MTLNNMEGLLYIAGGGVVLFLIYKFAKQLFFKIIIACLLLGGAVFGLYYFEIGPFKNNIAHIEVIKAKYCNGETPEICDCIVAKLEVDIKTRFTSEEIIEMKMDRVQCAYVYQKSMTKIADESKLCLKESNNEHLWGVFIKETLQLNNAVTEKVEELLEDGKSMLDDKMNDFKGKKENLDNRY